METTHPILRILLYTSIVLLAFEALGMALIWGGAQPPTTHAFVQFHTVLVCVVGLTAALILSRAIAPDKIDIRVAPAFICVLLAFNPLYPLLPLAVSVPQILIADVITIGLFAWVAFWRYAPCNESSC